MVGYLVNQYPKVSHAFIRREIAALERRGVPVARFSLRPCPDSLPDPADREEHARTRVVTDSGAAGLARAIARTAAARPFAFAAALAVALRIGPGSDRGVARHLAYLAEACVLRRWAAAGGIRHLHAHHGTNSAAVAMLCRLLGGPSYSLTIHGPEEFAKAPRLALAEKIRNARFVVGICEDGTAQLRRWCSPEDRHKVRLLRCGLESHRLRTIGGSPPAEPRVVCVGRLCPEKDQAGLIRAVGVLRREGVRVRAVLLGDGPTRPALERLAVREGVAAVVAFVGWASEARVKEELRGARALVLPSRAEGLPVVIMEAFAAERPVVSTTIAGIPELVEPGVSGWLVPPGSVGPLAAALREVVTADPARLWAMGREGKRAVAARHDVDRSAAQLAAWFDGEPAEDADGADGAGRSAGQGSPSAQAMVRAMSW